MRGAEFIRFDFTLEAIGISDQDAKMVITRNLSHTPLLEIKIFRIHFEWALFFHFVNKSEFFLTLDKCCVWLRNCSNTLDRAIGIKCWIKLPRCDRCAPERIQHQKSEILFNHRGVINSQFKKSIKHEWFMYAYQVGRDHLKCEVSCLIWLDFFQHGSLQNWRRIDSPRR